MNYASPRKIAFTLAMLAILALGSQSIATAHTVFKQQLQKKYPGLSIKCEVCHVKGEEKTVVNDFGKLFVEELVEHDLIEKWKALESDAKEAFEKETMAPVFDKAFEKIKLLENDEGKVWHDIFDAGEMENTKLKRGKTKGTEGLGEENAGDDDDSADDDKEDKDKKDGDDKDGQNKDESDKEKEKKDDGKKEGGDQEGGKKDDDKKEGGGDGQNGDPALSDLTRIQAARMD